MVKKEEEKSSLNSDRKPKKRMTAQQREELLVENFTGLQRAMTNLSIKFGALSENINKLLQIFEEAARDFSINTPMSHIETHLEEKKTKDEENNKDLINKLDSLIDQNKTIAKGLVLMEEKLRSKTENPPANFHPSVSEMYRPRPKPLPNR